MVFDAAIAATIDTQAELLADNNQDTSNADEPNKTAAENVAPAPDAPALSAGDDKPAPAANEILASNLQTSGPVIAHDAPNASQVVFLDGGLPNLDKLESSIPEDVEVVVLDTHGNGVQQITDFLADHTGYSALHIVSHGDSGEVFIGNSVLSDATLPQYSTQLQAWQNSLAPGADLLIYGCDVAAGTNGEHFIAELGRLTGTDVTASTDPTGSARFGGDWVLEAQTGAIDANSIDLGATGWDGELATASFKAIYQGTPSAASLQASNITLSSKLDANASSIKFISADPSTTYFSGNNVAGKLVYTDSSNVVHSIDGVISRQFKTGGTTNAFYFYAIGADGLVNTLVRDGGDDTAYLLQVNNDTTTYTYDNSASAMYRTSSDPVDTALNSTGILASAGPSLTAATSSSANASPAIEAGGISNGTAGQNGTGNVLDASLAPSGLSVISVGTSAASQSGISASTTSSTGTSVTGTYGTLTLGSDGTYKYVVDNSNSTVQALRQTTDTLTDTFTYTAKDGSGNIASTTLSVTIQGKNDAPVANSDYNTAKIGGTAVTGNVLGNDTDVDKYGETLSTTGFTATADLNTYTAGNTSISYSTSNGISSANGAYVFYLAGDGKYYPLSTLATASGSADGITVTVGGSSPNYTLTLNHDPLNYTIASGTRLGFANTWSSSFTPGGGTKYADVTAATSTAQITLKNITGNIVVGMTVTGTNIPDGTTVASISGTGITFNKSPTGTPGSMTFSAAGGATITGTYGTLVLNADGKGGYTYSPNASGSGGTDTFTYKMQDLSGATSTSTLNIQVLGASSTLTTVADTKSITVGTASVSDNVTTNDSSTGGTESVITGATAQAALGTTQTITSGSYQDISGQYGTLRLYSTGAYTYTLNTDAATTSTLNALGSSATLTDSFQYLATNATAGAKSAAALTITINGANDAPTLKLNTSGSGSTNFATSFTQGDTSPAPLATLTGAHIADVDDIYFSKLTVSFTQSNFADGSSEQLLINGASVTISGLGTLTTNSNLGSFTLGGVSYSYGVAISGGVATLSFNPTNAITKAQTETLLTALRYQNSSTNPTAGSSRVFSISVTDNGTSNSTTLAGSGTLTSSAATSTITVYNTSTAPIASVDTVAATEAGGTANGTAGTDPTGNVLTGETSNSTGTNVGDSGSSITVTKAQTGSSITGSASTVTAGSTSTSSGTSITGTYGTLVIGADGSYKYTVDNSNATVQALQQSGSTLTDTFSYQITDNASRTATAALTVTINGANDAPTVGTAPTNQTATVGTAFSYTVPAFSDVDTGDTITYSASGTLPAGITFDAATRTFSGTPTATQSAQTITITGTDSKGATVTTTFTLTAISASSVSASNDTASATEAGGTANGTAGTDPTGNVKTNDTGTSITVTKAEAGSSIDGSASTVAASSTSTSNGTSITGTYGTLVIGADGSYKYTVNNSNSSVQALQQGSTLTDTFSYQITDNASQTATATLTVTINGANDAPTVGTAPTNQTATVGTAFSYTVPAFSDVDTGDTITYSASGTLPAGITFDAATRT
ncbi:MAG: VCBS domain-containing protein, partial [Methylobacter sp.]